MCSLHTLLELASQAPHNSKRVVPWKKLCEKIEIFIDCDQYWPPGITLKEPSRLKAAECDAILSHWRERNESGLEEFRFSNVIDNQTDGTFRPAVYPMPAIPSQLPLRTKKVKSRINAQVQSRSNQLSESDEPISTDDAEGDESTQRNIRMPSGVTGRSTMTAKRVPVKRNIIQSDDEEDFDSRTDGYPDYGLSQVGDANNFWASGSPTGHRRSAEHQTKRNQRNPTTGRDIAGTSQPDRRTERNPTTGRDIGGTGQLAQSTERNPTGRNIGRASQPDRSKERNPTAGRDIGGTSQPDRSTERNPIGANEMGTSQSEHQRKARRAPTNVEKDVDRRPTTDELGRGKRERKPARPRNNLIDAAIERMESARPKTKKF